MFPLTDVVGKIAQVDGATVPSTHCFCDCERLRAPEEEEETRRTDERQSGSRSFDGERRPRRQKEEVVVRLLYDSCRPSQP